MATLKISDLSVGDWVRVINQFDAQIDGYHSESGSLSLKTRQRNLVHYRLEDIHPIPITAEILEKNGWRVIEKDVLGDEYEYDGEERDGMMEIAVLKYARRSREYSGTLGVTNIICGDWNISTNCSI